MKMSQKISNILKIMIWKNKSTILEEENSQFQQENSS